MCAPCPVATPPLQVSALMVPLEAAYAAEVARLEGREAQLAGYVAELAELQRRTANLE